MKRILSIVALLALQALSPQTSDAADKLKTGEVLQSGMSLLSNNGRYELRMQTDGNLVLYDYGYPTWASNTAGLPGLYAEMQTDGNLVVYDWARQPYWASGTNPTKDAELVVQDDGNLVVYGLAPIWASNTVWGDCGTTFPVGGRQFIMAANSNLSWTTPFGQAEDILWPGAQLKSRSGCYSLNMQTDANLVLYRNTDGAVLWSSNKIRSYPLPHLRIQTDGNLVTYSSTNYTPYTAYWATNTASSAGRVLMVQDDGNLVLYTDRVPVWDKWSGPISYGYGSTGGISLPFCVGIKYDSDSGWSFGC